MFKILAFILAILFSTVTSYQKQISETISASDQINLYHAADKGDINQVKTLLEKGYNINFRCEKTCEGWTPLMIASANGHYDIVKLLLEKGADPDLQNRFGRTALQFAVRYKFVPIIQILLDHNADPFIISNENNEAPDSSMAYALIGSLNDAEMYEILKLLVKRTEKFNFEFWEYTPLLISVFYDDYDFTKYLLENGANVHHIKVINNNGISYNMTIDSIAKSEKIKLLLNSYINKNT